MNVRPFSTWLGEPSTSYSLACLRFVRNGCSVVRTVFTQLYLLAWRIWVQKFLRGLDRHSDGSCRSYCRWIAKDDLRQSQNLESISLVFSQMETITAHVQAILGIQWNVVGFRALLARTHELHLNWFFEYGYPREETPRSIRATHSLWESLLELLIIMQTWATAAAREVLSPIGCDRYSKSNTYENTEQLRGGITEVGNDEGLALWS